MGDKEIMAEAPPRAAADDIGDGAQCADHPYRSNPGGICAFCLQEKLGKLVSSSSAASSSPFLFLRPQPSSSSSSPSFRSTSSSSAAASAGPAVQTIAPKKKSVGSSSGAKKTAALNPSNNVSVLKRSKSVAPASVDSPRKKSFWSFLYLSSSSFSNKRRSTSSVAGESAGDRDLKQSEEKRDAKTLESEAESPGSGSHVSSSSFSRKVARSRSVGCGSRSFSGDFLERISTGFGDCTLRRVESHRESNGKTAAHHRQQLDHDSEQRIKERVKCGGIFGGFGMISSSSSTYWLSAAASAAAAAGDDGDDFDTRRSSTARASTSMVLDSRSRNRSWAWAFASPMRAFKPATTSKSYEPRNAVSGVNVAGNGSGKAVNGGSGGSTRKVGANPSLLAAH